MSEKTVNIIPNRIFPIGKFEKEAVLFLRGKGIVDGFYDEENNWYAAGKNSSLLFGGGSSEAFEYAEICDSSVRRLVPLEDAQEKFGAICRNCTKNIDEFLLDALEELCDEELESGIQRDMGDVRIVCEECGHLNILSDISFSKDVMLTKQFICFVGISENINSELLTTFAFALGCGFKIIYGKI